MSNTIKSATKLLHTHADRRDNGDPITPGPTFASTFHLEGDPGAGNFEYGRFDQPGWRFLERKLAALEGGDVTVFPSGLAAISAVLMTTLKPGDKVLMPGDGYYPSLAFVKNYLLPFGITLETAQTAALAEHDLSPYKLVFIESPSNPLLDICDIADTAKRAHSAGCLLAVDNTTATILGQNPLALGADFSVASDTKALNGHSDVLFGHVAARDTAHSEAVRLWRKLSGGIPGPMETWLVERGLQTLDVRLERQNNNALQIARYLKAHPMVESIRYPGLEDDPSYPLACKQMQSFGTIMSFDLGSKTTADQFMARLTLIANATSFGGTHTIAERRKRWGTDDIGEGVIRLSTGIEHVEDIIADIEQALSAR